MVLLEPRLSSAERCRPLSDAPRIPEAGARTVNLRLAVRRLAYEATDCGLLSPDLAAGIRRKGRQETRVRLGTG
jgi:hypothetical protein